MQQLRLLWQLRQLPQLHGLHAISVVSIMCCSKHELIELSLNPLLLSCPSPSRAAPGGGCQLPYQLPCCPMPPSFAPPSSAACAAPYPATCTTPCYAPCSVPCLSPCPAPCSPFYATCGNDSCFASDPLPCEMPSGPCGESSPHCNGISQATSCNLTQCTCKYSKLSKLNYNIVNIPNSFYIALNPDPNGNHL